MPFPGGLEAPSNGTVILSAVAAFLYLAMVGSAPSWRRTLVKTASTALLGGLCLIEGGPVLLAAALFLSALGDLFLAEEGDRAFMAGLAAFLAAHVAYVVLFAAAGGGLHAFAAEPWRIALALALLAFGAGMARRLKPALPADMVLPVAVYILAILAMGVAALMLPSLLVIAGAILFVASDAILAAGKFLVPAGSPRQALVRPAVWILYYLAQLAITLGFLVPGLA